MWGSCSTGQRTVEDRLCADADAIIAGIGRKMGFSLEAAALSISPCPKFKARREISHAPLALYSSAQFIEQPAGTTLLSFAPSITVVVVVVAVRDR